MSKEDNLARLEAAEASNWSYRGEGAANLVLAYNGSNPFFVGKVLRLQKIPSESKHSSDQKASTSKPGRRVLSDKEEILWADWPSIVAGPTADSLMQAYARDVMSPLLGSDLVDPGNLVLVSSEFLKSVAHNIHVVRPCWRADVSDIDLSRSTALLLSDHSLFLPLPGTKQNFLQAFSVEIKPKCGFLPNSRFIAAENCIKTKVSRFTMHQVLKVSQGQIKTVSHYSPLDLFSGRFEAIRQAIHELFENPQNNLRVFIEGKVFGTRMDTEIPDWELLKEALESCISCAKGRSIEVLKELVSQLLFGTDALKRLLAAQKLDSHDIEGAIHAYNRISEEICDECSESSHRSNINNSSDHSKAEHGNKNLKDFEIWNSLSLAKCMKVVRDYLTAATAKDCSLMLTFQQIPDNTTANIDMQCSKLIKCQETGKCFRSKVKFLDLDLKPLRKMPHYYRLDQEIIKSYLSATDKNQ